MLPPSASLPYCALEVPRSTSMPSSDGWIDEIEERVDAAALRAVRVADAVDEHVHFVAGEPAHEDAGHARARSLQRETHFTLDGLSDDGFCADRDFLCADDIDWLTRLRQIGEVAGSCRHAHVLGGRRRCRE